MPQSLSHVILHVIFSTKERRPMIRPEIEQNLHAYIAAVSRDMGCHPYRVGGIDDHVHIVTTLSRTVTIAQLVEKLKTSSSAWMKRPSDDLKDFYWQIGYGSFSVSPKDLDAVVHYVATQREHHHKESFQDEFRRFCESYGVEMDERYGWD
jgi:putative transposase